MRPPQTKQMSTQDCHPITNQSLGALLPHNLRMESHIRFDASAEKKAAAQPPTTAAPIRAVTFTALPITISCRVLLPVLWTKPTWLVWSN